MTRRADLALANYTCPTCQAPPGRRCTRANGTRALMHPHPARIALVARPERGVSDARIASWVRTHAADLRTFIYHATEVDGWAGVDGARLLAEFDDLVPDAHATRPA